jgi:hypothetical protein
MHFPNYAETIGYKHGEAYDVSASKSESVKALSAMAKETGTWLLGGKDVIERWERPLDVIYIQALFRRGMNPTVNCTIRPQCTILRVCFIACTPAYALKLCSKGS